MLSRRTVLVAPAAAAASVAVGTFGDARAAEPRTLQQILDAFEKPTPGRYVLSETLTLHEGDVLEDLELTWEGAPTEAMIYVAGPARISRCSMNAQGSAVTVRVHPMVHDGPRPFVMEHCVINNGSAAFRIG